MVAKLLILEEEFPDEYGELSLQSDLLSEWQRSAAQADPPDFLKRQLVAFLRLTANIKSADVRPYLTLKQSEYERDLPGYSSLVTLLEDGASDELRRLLNDSPPELRNRYVEAAQNYFQEQVGESPGTVRATHCAR